MKHYSILIVTFTGNHPDKVGIYAHANEQDAIKDFYRLMGQYVGSKSIEGVVGKDVATVCVEAKSSEGVVYKHESWVAPVEENNEETEE